MSISSLDDFTLRDMLKDKVEAVHRSFLEASADIFGLDYVPEPIPILLCTERTEFYSAGDYKFIGGIDEPVITIGRSDGVKKHVTEFDKYLYYCIHDCTHETSHYVLDLVNPELSGEKDNDDDDEHYFNETLVTLGDRLYWGSQGDKARSFIFNLETPHVYKAAKAIEDVMPFPELARLSIEQARELGIAETIMDIIKKHRKKK